MKTEKRCGTCEYKKMITDQWEYIRCDNPDGEYHGGEMNIMDRCPDWEGDHDSRRTNKD